jgi:hypothetical protein
VVELDDVAAMALELGEVTEGVRHGNRTWSVNGKAFAWERPFSKADIKCFGAAPAPTGPIVALAVEDLGEKEAVLAADTPGIFTISHFDGYPAVLVQLQLISAEAMREAVLDAWRACAPPRLTDEHLA